MCQTAFSVSPRLSNLVDSAEHLPSINIGRGEPLIQLTFHPIWNRDCPDMARFADQVDDGPMLLALLKVI
jgi:hypothetical protein